MFALIGFLIIIVLSITVVRIGSTALELTGVPHGVAVFQSQSAFSGQGDVEHESSAMEENSRSRERDARGGVEE